MKKQDEVVDQKPPFEFHKCNLCAFRTHFLEVLLSHLNKHQRESKIDRFSCETANLEAFECRFCDYENVFKVALGMHITLAHGEDQHPDPEIELKCYICEKCGFETYSLLVFARHFCDDYQTGASIWKNETKLRNSEEGDTSSPWLKCTRCTFKSKYKHSLKRHVILRHKNPHAADVKWFQCEQCSYKARMRSNLKQHIVWKHADFSVVKWFECEQCSYKSKHRGNLRKHISWRHAHYNEVKWLKCEQCSYKTRAKHHLNIHISRKHGVCKKRIVKTCFNKTSTLRFRQNENVKQYTKKRVS